MAEFLLLRVEKGYQKIDKRTIYFFQVFILGDLFDVRKFSPREVDRFTLLTLTNRELIE